jgi:hypothetical protein
LPTTSKAWPFGVTFEGVPQKVLSVDTLSTIHIRFGFVVEKFSMKVRVSVLVSRICWNLVLEGLNAEGFNYWFNANFHLKICYPNHLNDFN